MKAILAIARVEMLRNWKLVGLPLSAVLGVLVLALMGTQQSDRTASGDLMGFLILFELPFAAVPAVVMGLNLFGPDIRQRRLSFFLTRPCSPWQLFLGRLLGAAAIAGVGWLGAGVVLPFMGVTGSLTAGGMVKSTDAIIAALGLAGLVLFMNAVAMILAANAPLWFLFDLVAGFALWAAAVRSIGEALRLGDQALVVDAFAILVVFAGIGLLLAGLAYLSFGRGDGLRGHRAHSLTLWSVGVASLIGLEVHRAVEWERSLASVFPYGTAEAVGPNHALVTVFYERGVYAFLLDTRSGDSRRLSGFTAFSAVDLKSGLLARVEERLNLPKNGPGLVRERLVISSATSAFAPVVDRPIPERHRRFLAVSDGGRLAIFSTWDGFEVIDTKTGAVELRYASIVATAAFLPDGTIAAIGEDGRTGVRLAILAQDGRVIRESRVPIANPGWGFAFHVESGRFAMAGGQQGVTLYERDGSPVAQFTPGAARGNDFRGKGSVRPDALLFTRAGDFLLVGPGGLNAVRHGETVVRDLPFTADGATLPIAADRSIIGEFSTGEIAISEFVLGSFSTLLVDPMTGALRLSLPGYRSNVRRGRGSIASAQDPSADSALRLLQSEDGDLVFLDPGATKVRLLVKSTKEDR